MGKKLYSFEQSNRARRAGDEQIYPTERGENSRERIIWIVEVRVVHTCPF
jgi:hypothetical protein